MSVSEWSPNTSWESEFLQNHPLTGKIWDTNNQTFIDPAALINAASGKPFVLLGEKHDNIDHHDIQAWITQQLLGQQSRLAVAFEMFSTDKTKILQDFSQSGSRDASKLAELTDWKNSGWPDWSQYQPIAQHAIDAGVPILATNMTRQQAMAMARENKTFLDVPSLSRMRLNQPLPEILIEAQTQELIRSHCGMMPESMVGPMLMAQTTKDAMMGDVMLEAEGSSNLEGAILITGGGHARKDWGIPWHLAQRAPDKSVFSLALMEVSEDYATPAEYAQNLDAAELPFDYVWFTPRVDMDDPCDKYADQLDRMGKGHGSDAEADKSE